MGLWYNHPIMSTIRSFIAIELPEEARLALAGLQEWLKALVPPRPVRWVAPQNIHLTLHFLGDVAVDDIQKVQQVVEDVTPAYPVFNLSLAGLGCFPNTRRPRIIWAGVSGYKPTLAELHGHLGRQLKVIGFEPDRRPYSPHLTIGRVRKGIPKRQLSQLGQVIEEQQAQIGQLAAMPVQEISLMRSDLKPTGAVYTLLGRGLLKSDA